MIKQDIVATLGTYEKDGQKKYISRNVGMLIETEKGFSVKLDATFNPAGCVRKDDGSVWLMCFEPKEKAKEPVKQPHEEFEDSRPF